MGKISLAILDNDLRYMENFANYVMSRYRHRFNLLTFSQTEKFIEFIRDKDSNADILLVSSDAYGAWLKKSDSGLVILISANSRETDGYACVERYSGADKIVSDILKLYENSDLAAENPDASNAGRENKIITVFSGEGGCGRTTFAMALCAHYARLKLRALYAGVDYTAPSPFTSVSGASGRAANGIENKAGAGAGLPAAESGGSGGLSDIIYTIKARPERLGLKLESLCMSASEYGYSYYNPPLYPMDIDELQQPEAETLIAKLRGAGIFDRVVFDTHAGFSMRNKTLLDLSDAILIIASGDAAGYRKLFVLKDYIDKCANGQPGDFYKRCQILLANTSGPPAEFLTEQITDAISNAFMAKVTALPYCGALRDERRDGTPPAVSNGYGAAVAEIARRI